MRVEELRAKSSEDLRKDLEESYRELLTLRFRLATRQLTDTTAIRKVRKRIARIQTILRERELGIRW